MRSTGDLAPGDHVMAVGFPFGIGPSVSSRRRLGPEARVPLARGRAGADQPDPVRRRRQPGQLRRAAGDDGRRGGRHRHRHPQPDPAARVHRHRICCADRERRRPAPACRPSDPIHQGVPWTEPAVHQRRSLHPDGAHPLRGQARRRRPGPLPRAGDGRDAGAGPPARRRRAGPGQDADRQDAGADAARQLQAHPVHARPGAGRPGRHAHLQPEDRRVRHLARPGLHATCCSPTRSTARRPRCRVRCSR